MTFGDISQEVYLRAGMDRLQPVLLRRWINEAYQELADEEHWPFLETSASGVAPLTIADAREIWTVVNTTDSVELSHAPRKWLIEAFGSLATTGTPEFWYAEGQAAGGYIVKTYPVKAAPPTVAAYYYKTPAALALFSDVPVVPSQYQGIIVLGTLRRAYRASGNGDAAADVEAERKAQITEMRHALTDQYPVDRQQAQPAPDRARQKE